MTIIAHLNGVKWAVIKWAFIATYRKPRIPERHLLTDLDPVIDKCFNITTNVVVLGDLNCDMLKHGTNAVITLCEDLNLKNIVQKPTCFKSTPATLLDVILVNKDLTLKGEVIPCPLSDFHQFITVVLHIKMNKIVKRQVTYRSYKHFDAGLSNRDLEKAPFHVSECLDVDDQCSFIADLYRDVLDTHAPLKTKIIKTRQCPYMNSTWRKAIFKKHQLHNRFLKSRTRQNWQSFRKQRNLCEKLKRNSIRQYMNEKCAISKSEPKEFWQTISPYLSDKNKSSEGLQLIEGDMLLSDAKNVADLFNEKFTTIADEISRDSPYATITDNHPSFDVIESQVEKLNLDSFTFKQTSVNEVYRLINSLKSDKATGYDGIPARTLKESSHTIAPILCNAINKMMDETTFPKTLKKAEVTPIHKAKSRLSWTNYRPVSILPGISKLFEMTLANQMHQHLELIYSKYLSAYRRNMGCHSVLTHATESWKMALDNRIYPMSSYISSPILAHFPGRYFESRQNTREIPRAH